ncbi:MAG TPA: proton-conducting transporter membrane subunit [Dermatophilaceae bacterium]|nr:proton-conducting transporter membrane subunit [Dermatophilaceae bacterium]
MVSFSDPLVLLPVLAPAAAALLVLVVDAVVPRRRAVHFALAVVALVAGLATAVPGALASPSRPQLSLCLPAQTTPGQPATSCLYVAGPVASTLQIGALGAALAVVLFLLARPHREQHGAPLEHEGAPLEQEGAPPEQEGAPPEQGGGRASASWLRGGTPVQLSLVLGSTAGASAVAAAHDLGTWLVALELATLPAVALVALRGLERSGAAAVSLLTTSLVSFGILVVGAALWVAATGDAAFAADSAGAAWADPEHRAVLVLSMLLILAGLGFKLSLVPFHAWTPQAYSGAAEPVAAFLAGTSKIAALAALVVVADPLVSALSEGPRALGLAAAFAVVAAISMTLGNVLALRQDDPVRLLAWSTVAQAGWVVLPLAALDKRSTSAAAGYVLAYAIATMLAFAVVIAVGTQGEPGQARDLTAYSGLLRRQPMLGALLGLALLSLAGLPPGVLGLVAKIVALRPVVDQGMVWLAVIAVANAVIGIAVYVRWLAVLLRDGEPVGAGVPAAGQPVDGSAVAPVARPLLAAMVLLAAALVVTSVAPQVLLGLLS